MAKKADYTIMKGDSSPLIKITVSGNSSLSTDWTCNQFLVLASDPSTQIAAKTLQKDSSHHYFEGYLTAAETDALVEETEYIWVWQVQNAAYTPFAFSQKVTATLKIKRKFG